MALLLKKKHIVNSQGKEEELSIYTTKTEAVDGGKPCKVIQVEVDGEIITGYIGCTDELDTLKSSSKKVIVDDIEYAERKYMGIKDMSDYMSKTYPDTYQTMTEITEDMLPDTSDCTSLSYTFADCKEVLKLPYVDTRNVTRIFNTYSRCEKSVEFPKINTEKALTVFGMYYQCRSCEEFPQINISKCTEFSYLYSGCSKAIKVSDIDFSTAIDSGLSNLHTSAMFLGCSSLRSITFNNLPIGTTDETLRRKCSIPDTVTEIIMNFREG